MGSGKTTLVSWILALQGFSKDAGFSLNSKSVTPVGMSMQLENYSNLALWFDEFRAATVGEEKLAVVRDSYNRQAAVKWTHDGVNRVIRTAPLVSGESTTDDAAARSRYPHVQVSEGRRRANHLKWFDANKGNFFVFFREILRRREEFLKLVMAQMDAWSASEDTAKLPKREMSTHAVPYAAFRAVAVMFESHTGMEMTEYHKFMVNHAALSSEDVQMDVNVNRFMDALVTAYVAEELENEFFLVETERLDHPPGSPNQGHWLSHTLYFHPQTVISRLNEWLRKQGQVLGLKQRDLRDQLSKHDYWVSPQANSELKKRIGAYRAKTAMSVWGIKLDQHPLGTRPLPDSRLVTELGAEGFEQLRDGMFVTWPNGDPRQGPLHTLVERWRSWWERQQQS
jgi:hypothetical protein